MAAQIIDGKKVSADIFTRLNKEVSELQGKPTLAVVLVGEDPASTIYVNMKERRCVENGFGSIVHRLPEATTQDELLQLVDSLNRDSSVNGILVQSPLPSHICEPDIIEAIDPLKDVDCFHPYNMGRLATGDPVFLPCTPGGVMELFDAYGIALEGKRAVVVGRSNLAGKPLALLLLGRNATVEICHSRTADLKAETLNADILLVAIGRPDFITADMVKEGAVVIDVGINRVDDPSLEKGYRITGDVEYAGAREKASWITPVPGGVGATTIAMLLDNCLKAYKLQGGG